MSNSDKFTVELINYSQYNCTAIVRNSRFLTTRVPMLNRDYTHPNKDILSTNNDVYIEYPVINVDASATTSVGRVDALTAPIKLAHNKTYEILGEI